MPPHHAVDLHLAEWARLAENLVDGRHDAWMMTRRVIVPRQNPTRLDFREPGFDVCLARQVEMVCVDEDSVDFAVTEACSGFDRFFVQRNETASFDVDM